MADVQGPVALLTCAAYHGLVALMARSKKKRRPLDDGRESILSLEVNAREGAVGVSEILDACGALCVQLDCDSDLFAWVLHPDKADPNEPVACRLCSGFSAENLYDVARCRYLMLMNDHMGECPQGDLCSMQSKRGQKCSRRGFEYSSYDLVLRRLEPDPKICCLESRRVLRHFILLTTCSEIGRVAGWDKRTMGFLRQQLLLLRGRPDYEGNTSSTTENKGNTPSTTENETPNVTGIKKVLGHLAHCFR
jgi:hypothetical protein